MATLTLNAPTVGLTAPTSWGSRAQIEAQLKKIWTNYGKYIQFASKESGIAPEVLVAFISVESGGNPTAGGSGSATQGLTQFNRSYLKAQLKNEFTSKRLSANEKAKLAAYGFNFDANGNTREFTQSDLIKPELNILAGSIVLGQLIDQPFAVQNGNLRLDKVITTYNSGLYSKWSKIAMASNSTNAKQLHDELAGNKVTQAYIRKIMGVNGALDIASKELKGIIV
jgi:soluble lytic murein transglycosylase-like protein